MRKFPLILLIFLLLISLQNISAQKKSTKQKKAKPTIISCGVCNQKAIYLPKPEFPDAAKSVRASGKVEVKILIDEKGNVETAKAISGHILLRATSEKAALQAKFEPFTLSGKPVKVIATIVYNFVSDELKETKNVFIETIPLGVLTDKALKIWFLKNEAENIRPNEEIQVQVTINLQEGKVILAKAPLMNSSIGKLAEMSALQSTFQPMLTEFPTIYGTGILIFKTGDFTGKVVENKNPKPILPILDFRTAIVNGKARNLEIPKYTEEARNACANGKVEVLTLFHSWNGKVFAAKAISGDAILFEAAEEAVLNSTFSPSNFNGDNDVYVLSKIVYNFDSLSKCLTVGIVNDRTLNLPKPPLGNIVHPRHLRLKETQIVGVVIIVDENGNVTKAKAVSGHPALRSFCESAARYAKFAPSFINSAPIRVKALLIYKIKPDGTVDTDIESNDKTVIGTPIDLVSPPPPFCNCRFGTNPSISVEAKINEQGKVVEAKSWAGHPILKNLCEKAALESKFLPTDINAKITIVYNFESLDEENRNVKIKNIEIR